MTDPAVQGVIQAEIQPIKAEKLMNLTRAHDQVQAVMLYAPQFDVPPTETGDLSAVKVTEFSRTRAREVALKVIAAQSKMEVNPMSADLLTLAYAYVSATNP